MIWVLIAFVALCAISLFFLNHKEESNRNEDSVSVNVVMLMNIIVKFAQSHHDSGLLTIREAEGLYIAILNGFESFCCTRDFYRNIYKLTDTEINWLMANGNVERESMQITLREGRSLATSDYAKQIVRENKQLFGDIRNDGDSLRVRIQD